MHNKRVSDKEIRMQHLRSRGTLSPHSNARTCPSSPALRNTNPKRHWNINNIIIITIISDKEHVSLHTQINNKYSENFKKFIESFVKMLSAAKQ
jgi:hypothetical protein